MIRKGKIVIKGMIGKKKATVPIIRRAVDECIKSFDISMREDEMLDIIYNKILALENIFQHKQFHLEDVQLIGTLNMDICNCNELKCKREDHYKANTPIVQATKTMIEHYSKTGGNRTFGKKGVIIEYVKTVAGWSPTVLTEIKHINIKHLIDQLHSVFDQVIAPLGVKKMTEREIQRGKLFTTRRLKEFKEQGSLEAWF
jgi:hypothetical protein